MLVNESNTTTAPLKVEWKILMDNCDKYLEDVPHGNQPVIQRVPRHLCRSETNVKKLFTPEVIALGPYHHDNPDLNHLQNHKYLAAKQLIGTKTIDNLEKNIGDAISEARQCYEERLEIDDDEFLTIMFFDACFLLRFIDLFVQEKLQELQISKNLQGFIVRDIFLLENQIPYVVLKALMNMTTKVDIEAFIRTTMGTKMKTTVERKNEPIHLLALLRTALLGKAVGTPSIVVKGDWQLFRSVTEMKDVGIEFKKADTVCLRDIKFKEGFIHSYLSLPRITIDDSFQSRFMNMIAMEMCPDSKLEHGIQSYVWFLDCLIHSADDVKTLRSTDVLFNALGTDEQVAKLLNEMAADLAPDLHEYHDVLMGLKKHKKNKFLVRFYNTHFSTSWTAISFVAAAFLIILTVLQTVFAIFPRN
ncbi:hypothetical protein DsansV1_C07g0071861 [Dioscorea sansibarensis]